METGVEIEMETDGGRSRYMEPEAEGEGTWRQIETNREARSEMLWKAIKDYNCF